ncbi:zinc-ribbon domain-containing protein [Hyphococcus sp.]|uniref:zinc-ribbon domain-containing protein n=1 Tax=Hyphococcus sp. TaxID=2038636 RepID=UPI0035C730FE
MIITCPDCATRYDVDDERFSPNGRSVRCSACGESWFVPAPELLDVEPLDKEPPKRRASEDPREEDRAEKGPEARPWMKVGVPESESRDGREREKHARRDRREDDGPGRQERRGFERDVDDRRIDHDDFDDDDDDALFDTPASRRDRDEAPRKGKADEEPAGKGWRKGRQFVVEDDEDEHERRPFFARKREERREARESLRFADEEPDDIEEDDYNAVHGVVDADWEDVDDDEDRSRGFGRKVRAERRRATALARMEDVRSIDPEDLDEEFFASLRVTPRELEKAISKARRRAEAREKNRLTPLRFLGWAVWVIVIFSVAYGAFFYRDEIVKVAPKAADAYAVIGIEANPYGLAIENVRHRLAMSTGGPTIEITGNLRNETGEAVSAPLLQAEALGARGELLARWTFAADQAEVSPGGMADFMTRAPAPDGVTEVALSFAPEKSVLESLMPRSGE